MTLLRRLFHLKNIYSKHTSTQILVFCIGIIIIFFISYAFIEKSEFAPVVLTLLGLISFYIIVRLILKAVIVNRYIRSYKESTLLVDVRLPMEVGNASINLEFNNIDRLRPIKVFKSSRLFLATFDFYQHTKHGKYLAKQVHYLILEAQLKRNLPHILFDSKNAKGNQFESYYLKAQKISVQGSFDDVFTTYVAQTYNIDMLSFITPEVMEALLDTSDYDVEIINDKLMLYAPLLTKEDISIFAKKGQKLAEHINDNIDTYYDNRLSGKERTVIVTPFARTLLKRPLKYLLLSVLFATISVIIIIVAMMLPIQSRSDFIFNQPAIIVYILLISNTWNAWKIIRDNKKATDDFQKTYADKPMKTTIL